MVSDCLGGGAGDRAGMNDDGHEGDDDDDDDGNTYIAKLMQTIESGNENG